MANRIGIPGFCFALALAACVRAQAQAPAIYEEFNGWSGTTSPEGVWRRNGDWTGATAIPADAVEVRPTLGAAPSASSAYLIFPLSPEGLAGVAAHREGMEAGIFGLTGRRLGDEASLARRLHGN